MFACRGLQAISSHYLRTLALFVYKNRARGQRRIRGSVRLKILTSSSHTELSCSSYFGNSLANFESKFIIEDCARPYSECLLM
ncbi:unnamed protein product [Hymenolepis diminuta]|uniref:Uncharacterized protein n=1 Tax=Hymenolepis diminuta TaxID=6216 RepID=A0A564ZCJ1_HYMDI|nr:unnamed protein product [Hymenolepis diminuta]